MKIKAGDVDVGSLSIDDSVGSIQVDADHVHGELSGKNVGSIEISALSTTNFTLGDLPRLHTFRWTSRNIDTAGVFHGHHIAELLISSKNLELLADLDLPAIEMLVLDTPRVRDIGPVGRLASLRTLWLTAAHQDFTAWDPPPPQLTTLTCNRNSSALRRLDGLERCQKLRTLTLADARLTDVSALRDHPALERLDLSRTSVADLRPLGKPSKLTSIQVAGRKVRGDRIRAALVPFLEPASSLVRSAADKKKKRRGNAKLPATKKRRIAKIETLLLSRDFERIDQGVELVAALDDEATLRSLLEGVRYVAPTTRQSRLVSDGVLESSSVVLPYRRHAMRLLLSIAKEDCALEELRQSVNSLCIGGRRTKKEVVEISLRGLDRFPSLSVLWLEEARALLSQQTFRDTTVKELRLEHIGGDLDELALPSSLRVLKANGANLGTLPSGWECLTDLTLVGSSLPFSALQSTRDAQSIHIFGKGVSLPPQTVEHFASLPHLKELTLISCPVSNIEALGSSTLRTLVLLGGTQLDDFSGLVELPVEELWLSPGSSTQSIDLAPLAKLPKLRRLGIRARASQLRNLEALSHLEAATLPSSLEPLPGDIWEAARVPSPSLVGQSVLS
ncbi:MAG: hypothetical protein AAGE52_15670 [Myxococcota bacterium]